MATFSDLEKEYNLLLQNEMATNPTNDIRDQGFFLRCQQRCSMAIRMKYLQQLEQYTGRNAIVYYSTCNGILGVRVQEKKEEMIDKTDY